MFLVCEASAVLEGRVAMKACCQAEQDYSEEATGRHQSHAHAAFPCIRRRRCCYRRDPTSAGSRPGTDTFSTCVAVSHCRGQPTFQ